ncbi:MAG: hypothetical protein J6Q61_00090 [Bacteroidales bacterium]|nr:hypothetical protein [Bacteroidales bacterium]
MAVFTDTITLYNKISDTEWKRTVVKGVQWTDKEERTNADGVVSIAKYASVTFTEGIFDGLVLNPANKEDCIVYGVVTDVVNSNRGSRISDLLKKYPRSGLIKAVKDNSHRDFLKSIKVVVG